MKKRDTHLGMLIDRETHDKLFYIAEYEGRTKNKEIEQLVKKRIAEFEEIHGEITEYNNDNT